VVLDLAVPVEFAISQLSNPDRIIVEMRLPGKAAAMPPVRSVTGNHPIPDTDPVEPRPERTLQMPPARRVESGPLPEPPALATARIPYSKPLAEPVRVPAPAPRVVPPPKPPAEPSRAQTPLVAESRPAQSRTAESKPPAELRNPTRAEPKNGPEAALAAKQASHGDRSLTRALGLKLGRVVLDPGHGGQDQGTVGAGGLEEKFLVLDVAQRLGALITQRLGSEVVYTRTDDTYVPLEARTELANEKRADLFLSLHANSSRLRGISGSETFYLNFTTSASALEVAARENATSEKSIHELQSLLQKIALKEKVLESREFAWAVQTSLYGLSRGKTVKNRGVKQAPFVVLIGAQMPSVLAEIAFLSNPKDEILLKRPEYRQRIAEALFKGVSQYAGTLSHFEVARGKGSQPQP
jgi:N-acetylmuramoyl-L-alanine amidase